MKQVLLAILILLLLLAGYLFFTTPRSAGIVALDDNGQRIDMLRRAPADARDVYILPGAGGVYRALESHPIASSWLDLTQGDRDLEMLPLLLGRADVIAWRQDRRTAIIANPDPLRRLAARIFLAVRGNGEIAVEDGLLFVRTEPRSPSATNDRLPPGLRGHLFAVHRPGEAAFPPIPRPAVSAVTLDSKSVRVTSHSLTATPQGKRLPIATYPAGAMLSTAAITTPEWVERLGRLVPRTVTSLLHDGALYAVYRVDSDDLIPRLYGVVVVPGSSALEVDQVLSTVNLGPFGTAEERRQFRGVEIVRRSGLGTVMEYATSGGMLLISFDRSSIERYLTDRQRPAPFPPERTVWFATIQPEQLYGAVDQLRDRQELSLLAPDLHESIEQTARWLRYVRGATLLEMARLREGKGEMFVLNLSK